MIYAIIALMAVLLVLGVNPEKDPCQHGQNSCTQVSGDDAALPSQLTDKNATNVLGPR